MLNVGGGVSANAARDMLVPSIKCRGNAEL